MNHTLYNDRCPRDVEDVIDDFMTRKFPDAAKAFRETVESKLSFWIEMLDIVSIDNLIHHWPEEEIGDDSTVWILKMTYSIRDELDSWENLYADSLYMLGKDDPLTRSISDGN